MTMPSIEEQEYEELIGDQLVTVGRSHRELERLGNIDVTIDGQKVGMSRITWSYDARDKRSASRLTTIFDAANKLYVEQLGRKNPIPLLCHREHMTPVAVC